MGERSHARWSCQWSLQSVAAQQACQSAADGASHRSKTCTYIRPMTNGSISHHYREFSSVRVFVCRGLLGLLILHQHHAGVKKWKVCLTWRAPVIPAGRRKKHTHRKRVKWQKHRHTDPFCTFYLQNVLKSSVQRLTNEVQQIMHASLTLCTHYYAWRLLYLQKVRWKKRNEIKKRVKLIFTEEKPGLDFPTST